MRDREPKSIWRSVILSLVVFALLFGGAYWLFANVNVRSEEAQMQIVKNAVKRAVLTCYAIEGRYPASIAYLKEHYGLHYDDDQYIVRYDAFASNIMPDMRVMKRGGV